MSDTLLKLFSSPTRWLQGEDDKSILKRFGGARGTVLEA